MNTMTVELPINNAGVFIETSTGHKRFSGDLGAVAIIADNDGIDRVNVRFRARECWRRYAENEGYTFECI